MEFDEICEAILAYHKHTHLVFSLESLANLARNGRVKPAVAAVARVLGISSSALHQKLNDESDFKVSEADRLSAMLGLTMEQRDACFFGPGTRMCQRKGAA